MHTIEAIFCLFWCEFLEN